MLWLKVHKNLNSFLGIIKCFGDYRSHLLKLFLVNFSFLSHSTTVITLIRTYPEVT